MPTPLQRVQAYADALINGTATPAQIDRIGKGYADRAARLPEYLAATQTGKAMILLDEVRKSALRVVKDYEGRQAYINAQNTAGAQVDTDFAPAP